MFAAWLKRRLSKYRLIGEYFATLRFTWVDVAFGAGLPAVIFVIVWSLGYDIPRWAVTLFLIWALIIAGYFSWLADHVRLIPKLSIQKCQVQTTPVINARPIAIVHVIPECMSQAAVEGCKGHLLRVLKKNQSDSQWQTTQIDEPVELTWSIHDDANPRTLYPGVPTRLNLCSINTQCQINLMAQRIPIRFAGAFDDSEMFRFDIEITAKDLPSVDASVCLHRGVLWNGPTVSILHSAKVK